MIVTIFAPNLCIFNKNLSETDDFRFLTQITACVINQYCADLEEWQRCLVFPAAIQIEYKISILSAFCVKGAKRDRNYKEKK